MIGLAYVLLRIGKTDEAIVKYDLAIASRRSELGKHPTVFRLKPELAGQLALYGKSLLWLDRLDAAEPILNEATKLCNEAYQADPEKADLKRALALSLYNMGSLRDLQDRKDEALGYFERSRGLRADLYKASPDDKNGMSLTRSEARVGNLKTAKEMSDKLGNGTVVNPEVHLERACALSQLTRISEEDVKAALTGEALTALERSVAEGYLDPFRIAKELDLKPLHAEARFITLLQTLKTQSQEGKK